MTAARSLPVFSIVFIVAYGVLSLTQRPLFWYYPFQGRLSFHKLPLHNAMQWYGWLASALIIAIVVTAVFALIPPATTDRFSWNWAWIVPLAAVLVAFYIVITGWWLS